MGDFMSKKSISRRDHKDFDIVVRRLAKKTQIPQVAITQHAAQLLEKNFGKLNLPNLAVFRRKD